MPLLVNLQPAGEYLGEITTMPAACRRCLANSPPRPVAAPRCADGDASIGENCREARIAKRVVFGVSKPMKDEAGFINLSGNLFDSAIMKTSVISPAFAARYLSDESDPNAFEGTAFVFDGPVDFHKRIDDEALGMDDSAILVMRGAGPIGYPGGAEVVNMRPPAYLIKKGIDELPCIGTGVSPAPQVALDPECLARGGGWRRARAGENRRPYPRRSEQLHGQYAGAG